MSFILVNINDSFKRWKIFIANRIVKIQGMRLHGVTVSYNNAVGVIFQVLNFCNLNHLSESC